MEKVDFEPEQWCALASCRSRVQGHYSECVNSTANLRKKCARATAFENLCILIMYFYICTYIVREFLYIYYIIYVHTHIYIYIYIYIHIYIFLYVYTCIYVCACVCVCVYVSVCMYVYYKM